MSQRIQEAQDTYDCLRKAEEFLMIHRKRSVKIIYNIKNCDSSHTHKQKEIQGHHN